MIFCWDPEPGYAGSSYKNWDGVIKCSAGIYLLPHRYMTAFPSPLNRLHRSAGLISCPSQRPFNAYYMHDMIDAERSESSIHMIKQRDWRKYFAQTKARTPVTALPDLRS
jgi:hypothetical protein